MTTYRRLRPHSIAYEEGAIVAEGRDTLGGEYTHVICLNEENTAMLHQVNGKAEGSFFICRICEEPFPVAWAPGDEICASCAYFEIRAKEQLGAIREADAVPVMFNAKWRKPKPRYISPDGWTILMLLGFCLGAWAAAGLVIWWLG